MNWAAYYSLISSVFVSFLSCLQRLGGFEDEIDNVLRLRDLPTMSFDEEVKGIRMAGEQLFFARYIFLLLCLWRREIADGMLLYGRRRGFLEFFYHWEHFP